MLLTGRRKLLILVMMMMKILLHAGSEWPMARMYDMLPAELASPKAPTWVSYILTSRRPKDNNLPGALTPRLYILCSSRDATFYLM